MSWDTLGPVAVSNPALILMFTFTILAMFYALSIALDIYQLRRLEVYSPDGGGEKNGEEDNGSD